MNLKSIWLLIAPLVMLMPADLLSRAYGAPPALAGSKGTQVPFASRYEKPAEEATSSITPKMKNVWRPWT